MEALKVAFGVVADPETKDEVARREIECKGRSGFKGLASAALTFSFTYFGQKFFTRGFKGAGRVPVFLSSTIFAATAGYLIVRQEIIACTKAAQQERDKE